jgi:16S rRNA (cytosine967-C5)-methyltransferase
LAVADVLAGRSLSDSLPARCTGLAGRDRSFAYDLVFGACRWKLRFDRLLAQVLQKPLRSRDLDLTALMLCGIYQLVYTRVPAHAAISETVRIADALGKRWATGLINGVLRRIQRDYETLSSELDREPVTEFALPGWLIDHLKLTWPVDWRQICEALNERPPMILRVNRQKTRVSDYSARLADSGMQAHAIPGVPCALRLAEPVDVGKLPGFAQGQVSVQDAGAQYAAPLLEVRPGQRVLDACAAPGGKTGHLLERCPSIHLTALDLDAPRAARIVDNLARLGQQAQVLIGDAARPEDWWNGLHFDRVLLDVPCTATGVIRRHPDIRLLRRSGDILALAARQDAILEAAWPLLRTRGKLLYSTCSLLSTENDERVAAFVDRHADARVLPLGRTWGRPARIGRQLLPERQGNDGFYYALLCKWEQ